MMDHHGFYTLVCKQIYVYWWEFAIFFFFFLSATVGEFCSSEVAGLPDMASTDVDQNASGLELLDTPIRPMIPERGQGVMHHSWDQSMY